MEEAKVTMTVEEVLQATVGMLEGIRVPAGLIDEIGIPLARSISNLRQCVAAMEDARTDAGEEGGGGDA